MHRRERWFYLFISPWLVGFILFQLLPILTGLGLSVVDWRLAEPPRWAGLTHIISALSDRATHQALLNTGRYALASVPLGLMAALVLALLLHRRQGQRADGALRALIFLPSVMPGVAVAFIWGWTFDTNWGLVNRALEMIGIDGPGWLTDPAWAMTTLVMLNLWGIGGNVLIYLAAVQNLPRELYEAAMLDGAGALMRFRKVTLPMLSPITFFIVVVSLINVFQVFTPVYLLTRGGPQGSTLLLGLQLYLTGFQFGRFSEAAALAVLVLLLTGIITLAQFKLSGKWVHYTL